MTMAPPGTKAVVYARVSSGGQRERHTIKSQLREVPAFCERHGWPVVGTFADDGKSAAARLEERHGFHQMMATAASLGAKIVAVVDQDRLTREEDFIERAAVLGAIQRAGLLVAITSTGQILDYRTDTGDLLGNLAAYSAALENRKRREKTMAGKRTVAVDGGKPQGSTPWGLGYERSRGTARWWVDEPTAAIIREIYERVAAGETLGAVGRDLAARRIRRPRGGAWMPARVWQIINSPLYKGEHVAHGRPLIVPAIVGADLWQAAHDACAERARVPPIRQLHFRLLARLMRCGCCGLTVGVNAARYAEHGGYVPTYRCERNRHPDPDRPRCTMRSQKAAPIDEAVWSAMAERLASPILLDVAIAAANPSAAPIDHRAAIDRHQGEIDRLARVQGVTLAAASRGDIDTDQLTSQLDRLAAQRRAAQGALIEARQAAAGIRGVVAADDLANAIECLRVGMDATTSAEERQAFARAVITGATMHDRDVGVRLSIPEALLRGSVFETSRWSEIPARGVSIGELEVLTRRSAA